MTNLADLVDRSLQLDAQPTLLELLIGEQADMSPPKLSRSETRVPDMNAASMNPQGMSKPEMSAVECFALWHASTSENILSDDVVNQSESSRQSAQRQSQYRALMPATTPTLGQQYAFDVDLDKCSGCKACVVACHTLNGLEDTETWRKVGVLASTTTKLPVLQHVTSACHHCVDPGCLKGCPVLAYEKDAITGIVRHLDDQCFGCKYCTMMCPYEVPQYSTTLGIVRKCDMCSQRLSHGEAPACVDACPTHAISIILVELADFARTTDTLNESVVATAPLSHWTLPTTRFHSQRSTATAYPSTLVQSRESMTDSVQHGHAPLVGMLILTQTSVGAWSVFAAMLFTGVLDAQWATTHWATTQWAIAPWAVAMWIATALGVIGVHLALLHLGRPWLAFRCFLGWRTSWLSREAIAFGVYMAASSAAAIDLSWNLGLARVTSVATACIGILSITASAMIYVATGRRLWSLARTAIEFFGTSLGLGLVLTSIALPAAQFPIGLFAGGSACLIAFLPKWLDWRRGAQESIQTDDLSARSGRLLTSELAGHWRLAWLFLLTGLAAPSVFLIATRGADEPAMPVAQACAWLAALAAFTASQMFLRWLAFASVVFPRMPGAIS